MMGRACRPSRIPRPFPLLGPVSLFQLSVSSGCAHLLVLSSTSRESRYVSRISSADSSYQLLYLRVNTNSQRGRRWEERAGMHTSTRTTTPRKKGEARAVAHSPSTLSALCRRIPACTVYLSVLWRTSRGSWQVAPLRLCCIRATQARVARVRSGIPVFAVS